LNRIYDGFKVFFSDFDFEYLAWARLLMQFVPHLKLTLVLDRTNWQFGETDINILCLTVRLHDVGLPIFFSFLDSQGNSQTAHRCDLLDKFDEVFGFSRIGCLMADREFIGEDWFNYLIINEIPFYIRLKKSFKLLIASKEYRVDELIDSYAATGEKHMEQVSWRGCDKLRVGLKKLPQTARPQAKNPADYLAILTNQPHTDALQMYRERWSIETFFQSIKERGVDIEKTHLQDPEKLKKLFAIVALTFAMALTVGVHHDQSVKSIDIKNHGYKQNSFARVGFDKLTNAIKEAKSQAFDLIRLITIIIRKITKNSRIKKAKKKIIT
jgi:Transposase DDE domain